MDKLASISKYFKEYTTYTLVIAVAYLFYDNTRLHTRIETFFEKIAAESISTIRENNKLLEEVKAKLK